MPKTKLLIDTDPGCDDIVALTVALARPDKFDMLGITSITGNTGPEQTQRNALGLCHLMGREDVPVIAGAKEFLTPTETIKTGQHAHGETGRHSLILDDEAAEALRLKQRKISAASFIIENIHKYPNEITLIVIGPMTNIAMAYLQDPSIADKVTLLVMGGSYNVPAEHVPGRVGNITPFAEFNTWCDPDAAAIVYKNFPSITAFPLDVTHRTLQDAAFRAELAASSPQGANFARMLEEYGADYPQFARKGVSPLHDFHTVAFLLEPDLYTFAPGRIEVETGAEFSGQTNFTPAKNGTHRVATHVNAGGFFGLLKSELFPALKAVR